MSAVVVTGTQWGDEGKGKIVDYLAEKADTVVRYQGGSNAGHTVSVKGEEFKLRLLPSGILYHGKTNVVGNGVIFDPEVALEEMNAMQKRGIDTSGIRISNRAHVVLPYHRIMDGLAEEARGEGKIGTTKRGIGPCTMDKMNRIGIRVCDLVEPEEFRKRLKENLAIKNEELEKIFGIHVKTERDIIEALDFLHAEGAQNVLLTLGEHGAYFSNGNAVYFASARPIQLLSSACAGDAALAAFLSIWLEHPENVADALKNMAAVGANVAESNALGTLSRVDEYKKDIQVRRVK